MPWYTALSRYIVLPASLVLVGCSAPGISLTLHSPNGAQYLGRISKEQCVTTQNWLSHKGELKPAKLWYHGQDGQNVYLLALSGDTHEVLTFTKTPTGLYFASSGQEISYEWR